MVARGREQAGLRMRSPVRSARAWAFADSPARWARSSAWASPGLVRTISARIWSSPRKMESRLRAFRVVRPLELLGGQIPRGGVAADAVVERLDVLEDAGLCLLPGGVPLVVDQLPLQGGEEALDRGVVPALADPAHAARDPVPLQQPAVVVAGVLAAPVRVGHQPVAREPAADRHAH